MIELQAACKRYGSTRALTDVDIVAPQGQVTAVVGPNGAGKSTMFRAVLGVEPLDSGRALVDGLPFAAARSPLGCVGAAIDAAMFHPGRRALDELRIAAATAGIGRRRAEEVLEEVGLGAVARTRVRGLSLGMRQRLSLAVALLGRPRNLVLDEPLNGLDVDGIHWMRDLLRGAADTGCTVLIASHVLAEVEKVADQVCFLAAGRVVEVQDAARLGAAGRTDHVEVVSDDPERLASLLTQHGASVRREGRALLVQGMTAREVAEVAFRERVLVELLAPVRDSLETAYLRLLAEAEASAAAGPVDPARRVA